MGGAKTKQVKRPEAGDELETLLTVNDMAELLQFTVKGIYSLVENRRIPFVKLSNRVRFIPEDVRSWLQENRVAASETDR